MKRPLILLLVLLAVLLGVLATLQYRWIDRVSDAERQQMRANIDFAGRVFADELTRELEPLVRTFEAHEDIAAAHPKLVQAAYFVDRDGDSWILDDGIAIAPWPKELTFLRQRLAAMAQDAGAGPPPRPPGPFLAEVPALLLIERRGPPAFGDGPGREIQSPLPSGERARVRGGSRDAFEGRGSFPHIVLVLLRRDALQNEVLPRLAQQHFRGYDVAVVTPSGDTLYRSNTAWPDGSTPDAEFALRPVMRRDAELGPPGRRLARMRQDRPAPPPPEQWRLLVRRHNGGMEAAVESARRRNLAVSFAIVLILGAAVLLLVALLRRAERLRQQQIEFVAAISHELNTPVAALRSAGENLRDGIIAEPGKVTRYGESIVRESTRLGELVGQVLELAGMQARRARSQETIDVASIIDEAVAQSRWLIADSNIAIETKIDEGLPPVTGDRDALTRAVQNLVANAVRHGGSGKWIGVQATRDNHQVRITVEDRGPGIDARDASHLFEPFYRGSKSSSVPGTGLGLAIVRQIALAHGGSVNVERRRPGAALTIHLPASTVPSPRNGGERARVRGGSGENHVEGRP
jgi:two-component system sensor histidine kinase SenX3